MVLQCVESQGFLCLHHYTMQKEVKNVYEMIKGKLKFSFFLLRSLLLKVEFQNQFKNHHFSKGHFKSFCHSKQFYVTLFTFSVQFSSVTQLCPTLCNPMNRSTPGLPVPHHLPEFTQTHVHRVSDAIQPPYPLSSPSPPAPNLSQHQSFPMSQLFA